jgi:hypothetical protein
VKFSDIWGNVRTAALFSTPQLSRWKCILIAKWNLKQRITLASLSSKPDPNPHPLVL